MKKLRKYFVIVVVLTISHLMYSHELQGNDLKVGIEDKWKNKKVCSTYISNPITVKSRDKAITAEAELMSVSENAATYVIKIKNFGEEEEVVFQSQSGDENVSHKIILKKEEPIIICYIPDTVSANGGISTVEIIRSSGEILSLKFPWGFELGKHL